MIAAINGACAGMGFAIALHCDMRFAASGVNIASAFARRGLIAEGGSSWPLPKLVGTQTPGSAVAWPAALTLGCAGTGNAMLMLLTGDKFSSEECCTSPHTLPQSSTAFLLTQSAFH